MGGFWIGSVKATIGMRLNARVHSGRLNRIKGCLALSVRRLLTKLMNGWITFNVRVVVSMERSNILRVRRLSLELPHQKLPLSS